jgi:hypothetical protein
MYINNQKQLVKAWAKTLQKTDWDLFSTITYRYDINPKQNQSIMMRLKDYLLSLKLKFKVFWVMEHNIRGVSTHNHLLIKGERVEQEVEYHLRSKNLIGKQVKHLPYEIGASYYVAKYLYDRESQYDIIESK